MNLKVISRFCPLLLLLLLLTNYLLLERGSARLGHVKNFDCVHKSHYGGSHLQMRQNPVTIAEHSGHELLLSVLDLVLQVEKKNRAKPFKIQVNSFEILNLS